VGGLPTGTVSGFAVHPANAQVMFAAMREGIFRSDDAGGRWTRAAGGPRNVAAVAINPKRPMEVWAATVEGRLFRSADGGARWAEVR
jgi:photosystem II stability/assembly factor-like uncharacterized protein